jgi:hypothetical protein
VSTGLEDHVNDGRELGGSLGHGYPVLAPWIGALGGFLAERTGANSMFAASQAAVALAVGYPPLAMAAIQNVSAALATMAALPKIALAAGLARDARTPSRYEPAQPGSTANVWQRNSAVVVCQPKSPSTSVVLTDRYCGPCSSPTPQYLPAISGVAMGISAIQ